MDISPYIKLMIEKQAQNLTFVPDQAPRVTLEDQARAVGTTIFTNEMLQDICDTITNNTQKLQLSINNRIRFVAPLLVGINLITEIIEQDQKLSITIFQDRREQDREQIPSTISVLGDAPTQALDLRPYLAKVVELEGSDLFITSGSSVKTKIHGSAIELDSYILTPELTQSAAYNIMTEKQIDEFEQTKDLDFAISLPDNSARFRVNVFSQRRTTGLVLRLIPSEIPTVEQLDLPDVLPELIMAKRGLLLMVGGTGSGKSTTLAAMINHRNQNSAGHILTIEDPVEFSHPNLKSIVNQREIGIDTESYARALKASLREAPDVILIGEIRDRETMEAALELANTGHLCISTLHANNANQAMERVINMFPQVQHKQLFMDLAVNLNAVISQRLIPDSRGKRCAAIEVMINTPHISNLILKGALNEIKEAMATSGSKGMRIFDDALLELYKAGRITLEEALRNADSRNDLEAKINFS
ncbi:MAG: PilT/PilU family type 4a pilus ATPase [Gammaproteobacteria bacterium]|nr:PilT/PilU family type 4a pilus ATPase [Gammaproteobacteria bacterium]MBW6454175.1 PilT/PilU family type 4a pilus ATPase [Methyloprofundus sp.]